jgi:hypothetical protein
MHLSVILFCLTVVVLLFFKKYEEFKGSFRMRGSGYSWGGGGYRNRTFDMVDAVAIVLVFYYLFLNN